MTPESRICDRGETFLKYGLHFGGSCKHFGLEINKGWLPFGA